MELDKIKRKLLVKYPLFGSIIAKTNFIEDANTQIAATDGKDVFYNLEAVDKYSLEEQIFIFAHEICHIAFHHAERYEGRDVKTWNIATDSVINAFLKKDGLPLIKNAIDIPEAINYDAETLYDKLYNEGKNKKQGHDSHDKWRDNKKVNDKNKVVSEQETFKKNREEKKKRLMDLRDELAKMSYSSKDGDMSVNRNILVVGDKTYLINWRALLREAVEFEVDWFYKNASIDNGVLKPQLEEIFEPETEILLDTSGSVDDELIKNFLRECKSILEVSKVKVGCFDTGFYGFKEIRDDSDIDNLEFPGGGGTDFNIAVESFSRKCDNKIIFTDGYADMPDRQCDAIWIVYGSKKINPKGGKVINIDLRDLKKKQVVK